MERLQLYRALTKRLLHELAYHLDKDYEDEDIGFLAEEDSTFRTFRKGVSELQKDGEKLSTRTIEMMARIVICHCDFFRGTPLTEIDDKEL